MINLGTVEQLVTQFIYPWHNVCQGCSCCWFIWYTYPPYCKNTKGSVVWFKIEAASSRGVDTWFHPICSWCDHSLVRLIIKSTDCAMQISWQCRSWGGGSKRLLRDNVVNPMRTIQNERITCYNLRAQSLQGLVKLRVCHLGNCKHRILHC